MAGEKLTFKGHSGEMLAARLDLPEGPHLATAIFAHCFTCSKDIPAARRISARLAAMGIAVLRLDFKGLGHSEGEFSNTTFTSNVDDLIAAARHLERKNMPPSLLVGHSLGGAAVIKAAVEIPTISAVATIGAPADPEHVSHNFGQALDDIQANGAALVELGGRPFEIRKSFIDDIAASEIETTLANFKRALLVMHAPGDTTVGIENAAAIFQAAKHPKSFVTMDNADHLISRAADAEYAADVIATWAARYLDLSPPAPPPGVPEGILRVSEADSNGFLQDINVGATFHTLADEPLAYGGTNRGMTPYQFLSAGLGACTSMTIRMYARRKGWSLDHVLVEVSHDKMHAQDASDATYATEKVDSFHRQITLVGDLDATQRTRLLEIADKCPVHQTLERTNHIKTSLRS